MQDPPGTLSDRPPLARAWPLVMVGLLGLVVALVSWTAISVWEDRLARAQFDDVAGDYATALGHGLEDHVGEVSTVRAFYDASNAVTSEEFELFTTELLGAPPSHYDRPAPQSLQASLRHIAWSPYVSADERYMFQARQRKNGYRDFQITRWSLTDQEVPAARRSEYFPLLFVSGVEKDAPLIGMDLNSEPLRSETIQRALENDTLAVAPNAMLRGHAADERGLFVALPVYRNGTAVGAGRASRDLLGVVTGTFEIKPLVDSLIENSNLPKTVDLYLFVTGANDTATPVYARSASGQDTLPQMGDLRERLHSETTLDIGDARMDLFVAPAVSGVTGYYRAWAALAFVVLVFAAVLTYMWVSLSHTLRLEGANKRILQLAQTDNLTDLVNRRAFLKRLRMAFGASLRGAPPFAVLFLDIDDFKDVNDTLGHGMGDELLKEVVVRLKQVVQDGDVVARFGGDEFAVLATHVDDPVEAGALAKKIGEVLAKPFVIEGHKISVTSSIGISMFSRDISGPDAMIVQADLALYGAKDEGRNCYRFHSQDLDRQIHERVRVADELRTAIENGDMELYYQPQVELSTGRLTGLEALVRWNHRTRGLLTPSSFVNIAERTGAVLPLGRWILNEACRQMDAWQKEGIAPDVLGVNVSGIQMKNTADLQRVVEKCLVKWNIKPGNLELELTESVLMEATQRHNETLENLRRLGTRIAIDDFGTGYSSLKYLTTYPVNRLKLAQEFVFRVTVDYRNAAVVRAAVRLANELGIEVIAEGVESESQMRFLIGAGCEQAQGFYFSQPVRVAQATSLLRAGRIEPGTAPSQPHIISAA